MNVAICDDNAKDTALICTFIPEHFNKNRYIRDLHIFTNRKRLIEAFATPPFGSVFWDICMDGINGVKTADKVEEARFCFALISSVLLFEVSL